MTKDERQPIFVECRPCGERWKVATLPMSALAFAKAFTDVVCPNCGESKELYPCPTDGPDAVTGPRDGKPVTS